MEEGPHQYEAQELLICSACVYKDTAVLCTCNLSQWHTATVGFTITSEARISWYFSAGSQSLTCRYCICKENMWS